MTTYLVTGANGFIGRNLCEKLLSHGNRVRALVRGEAAALERAGAQILRGDLGIRSGWMDGLEGVDIVIHCAGNARFGDGPQYHADNVVATSNLIDAIRARAPGITRLVFVSTVGAVDRAAGDRCARALDETSSLQPSSDYGRSKRAAESLVASSGLPFVILRPAMVVGAGMRGDSHFAVFARWALEGHLLGRIAWTGTFSIVDVADVVEALLLCATHRQAAGRIFLCGGHAVELRDFFDRVRPAARLSLSPLLPLFRLAAALLPFNLKVMLLPALVVDDSALRQLGWQAQRSPEEALRPVIERERARCDPMFESPSGQTVVTGAASGLGRALAERLAPLRSRLLLVDRDSAGLAALSVKIPQAHCVIADLAAEPGWEALLASPEWRAAPISELYACAGVGRRGEFAAEPIAAQIDMLRLNLLARVRLAHAVITDMARLRFGRIVLISSSSAFQSLPLMSAYAASNAALLSFGEGLAYEVSKLGIHVLIACPGGMRTNFQRSANVRENPGEKLMSPEEVAAQILRGLSRRRTTVVISARARAMALLARILPRSLSLRLWGRLMAALR